MNSVFNQIVIEEKDRYKTAFSTPFGKYEFVRMPFGLISAPSTFQRMVDMALNGLQGTILYAYIDDIIIFSKDIEEHNEKLVILFERLRKVGLKLQPSKCQFHLKNVTYLGHDISAAGVMPSKNKVIGAKNFPTPRNVKGVRALLGLSGYCRRFIDNFAKISKPLTNLFKGDVPFI